MGACPSTPADYDQEAGASVAQRLIRPARAFAKRPEPQVFFVAKRAFFACAPKFRLWLPRNGPGALPAMFGKPGTEKYKGGVDWGPSALPAGRINELDGPAC